MEKPLRKHKPLRTIKNPVPRIIPTNPLARMGEDDSLFVGVQVSGYPDPLVNGVLGLLAWIRDLQKRIEHLETR